MQPNRSPEVAPPFIETKDLPPALRIRRCAMSGLLAAAAFVGCVNTAGQLIDRATDPTSESSPGLPTGVSSVLALHLMDPRNRRRYYHKVATEDGEET